ncbi:hypothetical protein [uncultured Oscillibacter sp.]|uniref:hypothetical protein n=1 Tax=uncultured Oscillibacter sp. TaxID=876091 RepID=UPI0028045A69|nr:hypothetical protein [uncultured Oscillibacter sp.]
MYSLLLGMLGFLLFFLYDVNSFTWRSRLLHKSFALGVTLLAAATVLDLAAALRMGAFSGLKDLILLVAGALCLAALVYCLFFALPFAETYQDTDGPPAVCDRGVYALCRHPGVLCMLGMYLFWGLGALPATMLRNGLIFSGFNTVYVCFQDRMTFPRTFPDYPDYQKNVPFLIPTGASIRAAWRTRRRSAEEEGSP